MSMDALTVYGLTSTVFIGALVVYLYVATPQEEAGDEPVVDHSIESEA